MGANIGTTVTATVVSLAHMGRREEFERAFPIAVCHDVFNYVTVLVLLPLELLTGFLQWTAVELGTFLEGVGGFDYDSPFASVLSGTLEPVEQLAAWLFPAPQAQGGALIVFAGGLIFTTLFLLVKVMRSLVRTRCRAAGDQRARVQRGALHAGRCGGHGDGAVELDHHVVAGAARGGRVVAARAGVADHDRRQQRHHRDGASGGACGVGTERYLRARDRASFIWCSI